MTTNHKAEVTRILANARVNLNANYLGERKNALDGKHPMDEWRFICTREESDVHVTFDFFTGPGLRDLPAWGLKAGWRGGPAPRPGSVLHQEWVASAKPKAPHAADLLHSLISDSSAAEQSFASWCSEYGYDTDSRKALATYEECQRNADKLRKLFKADELAALSEALQDY